MYITTTTRIPVSTTRPPTRKNNSRRVESVDSAGVGGVVETRAGLEVAGITEAGTAGAGLTVGVAVVV